MVKNPLLINIHTLYRLLNTKDCYLRLQTDLTFNNVTYTAFSFAQFLNENSYFFDDGRLINFVHIVFYLLIICYGQALLQALSK